MARNLYVNVRQLQDGLQLPAPDVLPFSDDFYLFYSGAFNLIYGDTETRRAVRRGYASPLSHRYSTTVAQPPSWTWTTTVPKR
jgi:hypothetical protein